MSIAAYNRGSRLVAREADERMPVAASRADAPARVPRRRGMSSCRATNAKRIGKCTMIPDAYSGELSTWGSSINMWASASLIGYIDSVDEDDRHDAILSIVSAVQDAARAMSHSLTVERGPKGGAA